jgi:hypothetical protein
MIYLQLNFSSGFGDFYTYFCEVYFTAKKLKSLGYSTTLVINSDHDLDFSKLFQPKYYNYFDFILYNQYLLSTINPILDNYCIFNADKDAKGGVHCWELIIPNNLKLDLEMPNFNLSRPSLININKFDEFPKFNEGILKLVNEFKNQFNLKSFEVIHFREFDPNAYEKNYYALENRFKGIKLNDNTELEINKIINNNNNNVFICSNDKLIKDYLKNKYPNIIMLENDFKSLLCCSYSDDETLNLILTEFILLSYADKIFLYSNYSWISNFISYAALNNKSGPINPYADNNKFIQMGNF